MKMKRTLAGIAAGLVAVSAMATAVSADQETINLHYDLRTKIQTVADGTVTIVQEFQGTDNNLYKIDAQDPLEFGFIPGRDNNGNYKLGKLVEAKLDFVGVEYTLGQNGNLIAKDVPGQLWYADKDRIVDTMVATPFDKDNPMIDTDNTPADKEWKLVRDDFVLRVPVEYYGSGTTTYAGTYSSNVYTVIVRDVLNESIVDTIDVPESTAVANAADAVSSVLADYSYMGTTVNTSGGSTFDVYNDGTQPVYIDPAEVTGPTAKSTPIYKTTPGALATNHAVNSLSGYNYQTTVDATGTPYFDADHFYFKKMTVALTYAVPSKFIGDLNYSNWDVSGSKINGNYYNSYWLRYFGVNATGWQDQSLNNLRGDVTAIYPVDPTIPGKITFGALNTKPLDEHFFPLMTTTAVKRYGAMYPLLPADDWAVQYDGGNWADGSAKTSANIYTNDVIAAIRRSGIGTSPLSVLNDAIANDLDVTFTFTSASGNIVTEMTKARQKWTKFGESLAYDPGSAWSKAAFGQHLYSNSYNNVSAPWNGASFTPSYSYNAGNATSDMYGSYSSAWAQNLVSAGLVVNSELTMQLNDTKKLTWNENQLTFNWFDVTDETKITRANQILTTMLLYTPVDWYWDSLDVTVIEPEEEEDVNAGEGIEEDGEVLDEEIEEEEVEEEEVEEEEDWEEEEEEEEETEPEIEEVEVEETEAEVVEVAPVASPKTGNSPIALAVIPVALAAAAVVAKKRG